MERTSIEADDGSDKCDDSDDEFTIGGTSKKKPKTVTLTVPTKTLAKETAVTAKRHTIGVFAQRDFLVNIMNIGGDVSDFSLSNKTVRTAGVSAVNEAAEEIKTNFRNKLVENMSDRKTVIVHFDGKSLAQFHDHVRSVSKEYLSLPHHLNSKMVKGWGYQ